MQIPDTNLLQRLHLQACLLPRLLQLNLLDQL